MDDGFPSHHKIRTNLESSHSYEEPPFRDDNLVLETNERQAVITIEMMIEHLWEMLFHINLFLFGSQV